MLTGKMREALAHQGRRYGIRRIAVELSLAGSNCGHHRTSRILKSQELRAIQPKSLKPRSAERKHRLIYSPNLLMNESATDLSRQRNLPFMH